MTAPKIAKALNHLDDELIMEAAEEKTATRFMTKKKFVALLAATLMLVLTFAMMGTAPKPLGYYTEEEREAFWLEHMDSMIAASQDDPEALAYYTKWRELGYDAINPWPDEWEYPDGTFKSFVTIEMIKEVYKGSLLEEYMLTDPVLPRDRDIKVEFFFSDGDDHKALNAAISYLGAYK